MKFQLKNVGKIKDAEFELKPLTVFIGANGSGKTYAASALWGVANYLKILVANPKQLGKIITKALYNQFIREVEKNYNYKQFLSNEKTDNEKIEFTLPIDLVAKFKTQLNKHIINNSNKILDETFNHHFFDNSALKIQENSFNKIEIILEYETKFYTFNIQVKCNGYKHGTRRLFGIPDSEDVVYKIFSTIINGGYFVPINDNFYISDMLYIPAARTGLMFITHDIVQNQFERSNRFTLNDEIDNRKTNTDLTIPLNDFIAKIHNASRPKSELNTENQLFNKIMGGKLVQREGQYRFDFQPNGLEQAVPLSASSSLVTELAALSALEDNIRIGTFIILEEPEAHLHLSAQREMAKLIVRLINEKKCRILLTTHSDTFLQQINNLIMLEKLSRHNENALADFGIQAAEVIAADDVAVYDFQCAGNETRVENLACGEYGFVAKSMNDVLIALAKETQSIIEQIDDLEAE